jgi:3-polyprenyl-4-hydroxybenzoate decarboxylase
LFSACVPPASAAYGVTQKRCGSRARSRIMSFARQQQQRYDRKRRCARMKVLIGVDPHKATLAVAVVDEALGELVECASFLQNRAGLRSLERWAKR